MADSTLGVAVIGAGAIAEEAHLPAWRDQSGTVVRCVVDTALERAQRVAADFGIREWATEYHGLLDRDDVDAVDICLPPRIHAEATVAFLRTGKHVLVEKPFVTGLDEARRVLAAEDAGNAVLMVAENWSFASATQRVQQLLEAGMLGEPFMLRAHHESGLYLAPDDALPPVLRVSEAIGGYTMCAGIHSINRAAQLMGGFEAVFAYTTSAPPSPGPFLERDVGIAARFCNGGVGTMSFTGQSRHLGDRRLAFGLFCTRGVAEFDVWSGQVATSVDGAYTEVDESAPSMGYREEIAHFYTCIETNTVPLTNARQQLETLAVVLAVYRSMYERKEVRPADVLAEAFGQNVPSFLVGDGRAL